MFYIIKMVSLRSYGDNHTYPDKKNCIFAHLKKVRHWPAELISIGSIILHPDAPGV